MTEITYLAAIEKVDEGDFHISINGKYVVAIVVHTTGDLIYEYTIFDPSETGGDFNCIYYRTGYGIFKMKTSKDPVYPQPLLKTIILGGVYTLTVSPGMGLEVGQTVKVITHRKDGLIVVVKCNAQGKPDLMKTTIWVKPEILQFKRIIDILKLEDPQ